jgi:hypothetical protein
MHLSDFSVGSLFDHQVVAVQQVTSSLADQVAIVTGAGSGIGRAVAQQLGLAGASVLVCDVDGETAQETTDAITQGGGRATACRIDLADVDRLPDVVATAESAFGGVAVWLHDHEIAAVAADNDAVEGVSRVDGAPAIPLHMLTLRDMGMPLGEGFYLEELAADCADDGVYECMLVAPALRATGGVGSPVNPLAMK